MYGWLFGVDVRVDAQRDRGARTPCSAAPPVRCSSSAADSTLKQRMPASSAAHVGARSCRRRRTRPCRHAPGGQHARQLAAGDDVEARAPAREHRQDAEVGVGLDRVADQREARRRARPARPRRRPRARRASKRRWGCRSARRSRRAADSSSQSAPSRGTGWERRPAGGGAFIRAESLIRSFGTTGLL
jgi:hypothetical protein